MTAPKLNPDALGDLYGALCLANVELVKAAILLRCAKNPDAAASAEAAMELCRSALAKAEAPSLAMPDLRAALEAIDIIEDGAGQPRMMIRLPSGDYWTERWEERARPIISEWKRLRDAALGAAEASGSMSERVRNGMIRLIPRHIDEPIWIAVRHIMAIYRVTGPDGWTEVTLGDDREFEVRETPDEIHALIALAKAKGETP